MGKGKFPEGIWVKKEGRKTKTKTLITSVGVWGNMQLYMYGTHAIHVSWTLLFDIKFCIHPIIQFKKRNQLLNLLFYAIVILNIFSQKRHNHGPCQSLIDFNF
jgi:hypothetical protein